MEEPPLSSQILETWDIHQQKTLELLEQIHEDFLTVNINGKGKSVGVHFAHMHKVRLMWLKSIDRAVYEQLSPIEKGHELTSDLLRYSLRQSGDAVKDILKHYLDANKLIPGFKNYAPAFMGYLISHESHHRGQIILTLKQTGHKLDTEIRYGIWEWGRSLELLV